MILPVFQQGGLFLGSIAAGFVLAFFYDIFRVFRRITPHSGFFVHLEDILYWLLVVAVMFLFLLESNSGEIRFFTIAGAFAGMFVYYRLLSSLFLEFSLSIYNAVKKAVILMFSILISPFKAMLYLLSFPAAFVSSKAKDVYAREKKLYYNIRVRNRHKMKKIKNNFKILLRKI